MTDPRHTEIVEFLETESTLLDDGELPAWLELFAPDVVYRAPVRLARANGQPQFDTEQFHLNENYMMLALKVLRMAHTESAWSENPASRTQRIVHKIRAYDTDTDNELEVRSSIVLLRSRWDETTFELTAGRRIDIIRCQEPWKIASRTIYFDQTALGAPNLSSYL
ncbi:aromatic-ring-hydroxylating dioxygenase subunit beta [Mycobacterium sp. CVI_P3]|uniref:Aromatic-ring-hydroxylating dioxygenase subunit beta n=1 Tax=Mycobacterium pinniadriaticum TaxID=2994102 RepID=A0ABT3SMD0_9MYCO|nr:aromatic-ring-hydroxylating dioxygenase subunit beta [Mycobacterium pinniadriaticum]MCX2934276.1 aromatic-ring-hydroxylating dioxygenase subunit beta [Mycobacterium pinniadriaticum]MCX2940686.1 aromatic-ring-hydroxylating dioxygenase subunit beta [Mycobacterium pinniadriaticum]